MAVLFPGTYHPNGFQNLAMTGSALALTVPAGSKYALIQASAAVYWRDDGVAPVASAGGGIQMTANAEPQGFIGDLSALQFIGATGNVTISYYK